MNRYRSADLLKKQESMDRRTRQEAFAASRDAAKYGLQSGEQQAYVNRRVNEYQKTEIIRRSVNDVKKRGEELE